jgi:hypothetical protein
MLSGLNHGDHFDDHVERRVAGRKSKKQELI